MDAPVTSAEPIPAPSEASSSIKLGAISKAVRLIWAGIDAYTRRRLILSFLFLIGFSGLSALTPVLYKWVIDSLTGVAPPAAWLTPAVLIATYVLIQFAARICGTFRGLVHGQGLQRLSRRLGVRLFRHIVHLPLPYHLERKTGAISETLGQGLSGCHTLLQHLVFTFLPVVIEFLAIALVLVHYGHWKYLALFTVSGVAYAIAFGHAARIVTRPAENLASAAVEANSTLVDSVLNYETVKYFGGERTVTNRVDEAMALIETRRHVLLWLQTTNGLAVATIFTASLGAALGLAGYDVLRNALTIGDFVLINTYVVRLVQPLETIGFAVRDMAQAIGFLQKMLAMLDEKPEADDGKSVSALQVRGELTFENVSLSYGPGRFGLSDISFRVPAGHTVAVVGASGSGKSSLVRLLFRLYEPQSGRILLDGAPVSEMSLSAVRNAIAVVPQDTVLFNDSIRANLAFGNPEATQEEIERAARLANLDEFIKALPEGYETRVGERGVKLSGGEKQRVAIARAALKQPRIFVFDEATSSLDSRTEKEVIQNLVAVSKGCTTLVIAHRLSTVVHADEILVFQQGRIVERGAHAELLNRGGVYAALWRSQHGRANAEHPGRLITEPAG